jgi:hypothetical protein
MQIRFAPLMLAALSAFHLAAGETIKCPDTRDVWISAADRKESDTNGGKAPRMKLKVWQEYGLLDFDVSALKGKKIEKATLHVAPDGGAVHGGKRGTDLRWFTVSTISSDWVEGEGAQYSTDDAGKGATFNEASYKTRAWSYPGSKNWDVILGNGNTLRCDVDAGDPQGGWFTIPLDKRVVEALVAKASHGLLIMDGSTGVDRNCSIASRESNKAPYLNVTVSGDDAQPPAVPAKLTLTPAPKDASDTQGAATLSLTVPQDAFAYEIKVNGAALPRWQVPFATAAGATQTILLEYLQPDADLNVEVAAIDNAGNASAFASVKGKASPKITVPKLPASDWAPKGGDAAAGKLKLWACPEMCKIDPQSGKVMLEEGAEQFASKNSVWDGAASTVRIASARGEIAGFQLILDASAGDVTGVKVAVSGLDGIKTRLWKTWYVKTGDPKTGEKWQPEYALPLADGTAVAVPGADSKVPNQKATSIAIDLIVPADARPGEQSGTITVSGEGVPETKLPLKLKIYSAVIPKEINFTPELNCYGGPGQAGSDKFFDSFRVAHYHRCTINRVPYSQSGNIHADWVPQVGPDGKVSDWSNFDKNLGPLLDGSAFKDNPRANVPVPCLYMPHNENWPLPMRAHYNPGTGVPLDGKDWKAIHDIKAKPPVESFSQQYKDAFSACVRDFVNHFEEKGWTRTNYHVFNNNKQYMQKDGVKGTAWVMDEPFEYLDWQALNFYSTLMRNGTKDAKKVVFQFRADVSRPMWQGSCSDGLMEIVYANSGQFSMFPLMKELKREMPTTLMCYGAANKMDRANHETAAWCLKAYVYENDGVLPWQSIGGDAAFDTGDGDGGNGNMLIVDGSKRFGVNAVASYRVHAFRAGAQIVELLRLLQQKNGWGRSHSNALVSQLIPLRTEFSQAFADDAAAVKFKGLAGDPFVLLKEGILKLLEK